MEVRFRLPKVSLGAVSNLVGLAGLLAIAVAAGGLTGNWWWTCLIGGVFAVGVAYMAGLGAQEAEQQGRRSEAGPRPVAKAS